MKVKDYFFKTNKVLFLLAFPLILTGCKSSNFFDNLSFKKLISQKDKSVAVFYDAIAVWQNNGEGNWDIAYSIYRQNGDNWFHQTDRDIYYEGDANLIAKLPGDDNDPDIASTKHSALAVWSNTGVSGNQGADIFFSKWNGESLVGGETGWDKPVRLFALPGDDLDPTVYMQDSDNAMVVWINKNGDSRALYYSQYIKGAWSDPEQIIFGPAVAIATPELGYITLPGSRYLLVFTARVNGAGAAYLGTYDRVNEWEITKLEGQNIEAVVDESIPANYRTSASMHVESHKVAVSWMGEDGNIWYMKASPADKTFNAVVGENGSNPVVLHDPGGSSGTDTILFSVLGTLLNITPIGGSNRQTVSSGEPSVVRSDATYLWEQGSRSAVAVWATDQESPSEIYFSAVDRKTQQWTPPDRIDKKVFPGEDKNPAITPILVRITEENTIIEEEELALTTGYCGDKILDKRGGEECEIGIDCKKKNEVCDWDYYTVNYGKLGAAFFSDCECGVFVDDNPDLSKAPVDKAKPRPKNEEDLTYGGASCGFNSVVLKSEPGGSSVKLQLLPKTDPANGVIEFTGAYPSYQRDGITLFPLSDPPQPKYFVNVDFSTNDDVITLTGVDLATNFQLCIGTFTKGTPPESGGFTPAPASAIDSLVPSLPPE